MILIHTTNSAHVEPHRKLRALVTLTMNSQWSMFQIRDGLTRLRGWNWPNCMLAICWNNLPDNEAVSILLTF